MLTEEQRESVRYASEWLGRSDDIGNQKHAERLRTLLATHNARAQEPVAWRTSGNDLYLENPGYDDWTPLYAHPQPMTQTDAARDVLVRAKRMLEGYADSYKRMGQDSTSRGGDGRITCTAIMYDIRNNMIGWINAEIERLDRAKDE